MHALTKAVNFLGQLKQKITNSSQLLVVALNHFVIFPVAYAYLWITNCCQVDMGTIKEDLIQVLPWLLDYLSYRQRQA